ncbi:transposase [Vagococcus silagei]|uniref:transposase n=1 Tax=Vagococcus silagei TaxID=2508885 RepID=UPI0023B779AF|nr:transposase [Vagococcus silagei]
MISERYNALKFVRPEPRCRDCPLQHEGLCQKVIKIKQSRDYLRYNYPARGSQSWKQLYAKRSAVERMNTYLKENYQLNRTRFHQSHHVVVEHLMIQLAYNAKKFTNQRLNYRKSKEIAV